MLKVVCSEVSCSVEVVCSEEVVGGTVEGIIEEVVEEVVEEVLCDGGAGAELDLGGSTFVSSRTNQMSVPKMAIYRFWWLESQSTWTWATLWLG